MKDPNRLCDAEVVDVDAVVLSSTSVLETVVLFIDALVATVVSGTVAVADEAVTAVGRPAVHIVGIEGGLLEGVLLSSVSVDPDVPMDVTVSVTKCGKTRNQ